MNKRFECWNCGHRFEADDGNYVECPKCHSDNVEYASIHTPKYLKQIVLGSVCFAIIGWGISAIIENLPQKTEAPVVVTEEVNQEEIDAEYIAETGLDIPPTIRIVGDILPDDDGLYSFDAVVSNPPKAKYVFVLLNYITKKVVARSEDGKFTEIPYSESDGGTYIIQISDAVTDSVLCTPMDLPGFIKIEKINKKMTPSELQALLNKKDESLLGVGENKYLSPVYKLHFIGLPTDALNKPTDLAGVLDKISYGVWKSATVTSLEYDDTKHINSITFKVVVAQTDNDDWE